LPSISSPEHEAGADEAAIDDDRAGTAVAGTAAFLGTREAKPVAQHIEQRFIRLAGIFDCVAVDGCFDENGGHHFPPARA
jgi:hypothetical protein